MRFMIRQIREDAKLADEVRLGAIEAAVPRAAIEAVVADLGVAEQRRRLLPAELTVMLAIAMNLFCQYPLEDVLSKLLRGLRLLWPEPDFASATKSAICQARYRLGVRPLSELFHRVCKPLATADTKGAFLFGLHVMAIDGTTEDLPDTPQNARAFGRPSNARGGGAFPQIRGVYLIECGTHAFVDAGFWPYTVGESLGAQRMLRSVSADMLLMWDMGIHSYAMAKGTRDKGAHFLGRVRSNLKLKPLWRQSDGSYVARLFPSYGPYRGLSKASDALLVRVIAYTLTDPALVGYGETHRLITSLLDPLAYPALDLVCAYHERWEFELAVDETDTHQRQPRVPLRSKKPIGVLQEMYGLLIAHYVVRQLMHQAALQADLDPDRLSFTKALRLLCDAIPDFQLVVPAHHSALYQRLLHDIARHPLPDRAHRINPRVVRRMRTVFGVKRPRHRSWPQPSIPFRNAIVMLN